MQLLYSRAAPGPEFASLSLLLKSDISGDQISCRLGEPMLLPSPLSTISKVTCVEALKELHQYINSVFKATRSSKDSSSSTSKMLSALLQEDEKLLNDVQVFRPRKSQGMGLHYRLIRDRSMMSAFIPLVFNASKATATASKGIENDVTGVVLCVGMTGLPSALVMSSLHYSLSQRMRDCLEILTKCGAEDVGASRALLTTILLTEDEDRITNSMAEAATRTLLSEIDDGTWDTKGKMNFLGQKRNQDMAIADEGDYGLTINSADQARIMVERLAVLSVAENDTIFRKYENKANAGDKSGKTRRRKVGRDADLDGFEFKGEKRSSQRETSTASVVPESSSVKSVKSSGTSKLQLKQPKKDTASARARSNSKLASGPTLLAASHKDTGGRSRRAIADPNSRTSRPAGTRRQSADHVASWADNTNGNTLNPGHSRQKSVGNLHYDGDSLASSKTPPGSRGSRDRPNNFDPFASSSNSDGDATASTASETTSSSRRTKGVFDDDNEMPMDPNFGGNAFGDDNNDMFIQQGEKSSRSLESGGGSAGDGGPRVQVNVALNEDLTCFYKLSKMSSCSVEGVLQVQVKSNTQEGVPFFLLIRDPSKHIHSIQENKKFADNLEDSIAQEPPSRRPDYKFTVSVPKADNYFPVMRYKCGNELRPVPIRVQTRVRPEGPYWRVALQISSNPHNEDNLTDLTIIMGVPPVVRGESLTTSPTGGVWNASKRSVIWCVSELGGGEKFQLQARFEIDPDVAATGDEKPKFPVLVRCQCMYAQLSDVEVEVQDIPEVFPAEVRMKLARRFRLSHRERP